MAFNEKYYLEQNPDVKDAVEKGSMPSGKEHYIRFGMLEGRKPSEDVFFDPIYYAGKNQGVLAHYGHSLEGLWRHFENNGYKEGRKPSVGFDKTNIQVEEEIEKLKQEVQEKEEKTNKVEGREWYPSSFSYSTFDGDLDIEKYRDQGVSMLKVSDWDAFTPNELSMSDELSDNNLNFKFPYIKNANGAKEAVLNTMKENGLQGKVFIAGSIVVIDHLTHN